ncbi:SDR family NAD(P)-dependent oxidoreductase [Pseudofrankia inefficax]|uniref:Short-chain dehydrogenase/reductase SDR n=1 Tax=Pseudofrankia inefficax (strain DSM 45817 / CECT 9037 / DDB 130130 / EuI1c) TaxID=298654 RepID=E3IVP7_PSEI1|nr:SDR family NAD(P)-dependent oxidoreductase [Pseudofrankia inefficax]ADP83699.1 short-chain dehydrogenase/reductase SDR [Pseudofrankia inefficax]
MAAPRTHPPAGPWAVVAGASEGLGAAWVEALARRGLHVLAVARRPEPLEQLARRLSGEHGVEVRPLAADLAEPDFGDRLAAAASGLEIGTAVYNAAFSFAGPLLDHPPRDAQRLVDVNIRGPLALIHQLVPAMTGRRRGSLVLMSSLAGNQGGPSLAAYAASKAFTTSLAESLHAELRPAGVDVLACVAGAVRTPGYAATVGRDAPGTLDPAQVVEAALAGLGRRALVTPGHLNKLAAFAMRRVLPRATATAIMGRAVKGFDAP